MVSEDKQIEWGDPFEELRVSRDREYMEWLREDITNWRHLVESLQQDLSEATHHLRYLENELKVLEDKYTT